MTTTKNPWNSYWQKGAKASFLDEKSRLQTYQMRKFWFERMDELEPKQPIVDIGTGNGIALEWLTDYGEEKGKKLTLMGIDSADINPPNKGLKLSGKTPYETFKLTSNKKVGTFVSHFGLEYGEFDEGLKNVFAQLKRGGALVALVHSKESVIYIKIHAIYELIPSIVKQLKKSVQILQEALLKYGPEKLPRPALEAQHRLNEFARRHQPNPAFHATNFVPATKHLLQAAASGRKTESIAVFEDYLTNITEHKGRLATLLKATEDLGNIETVKNRVEQAGFKSIKVQQVQFPETGIVGNCIQAKK